MSLHLGSPRSGGGRHGFRMVSGDGSPARGKEKFLLTRGTRPHMQFRPRTPRWTSSSPAPSTCANTAINTVTHPFSTSLPRCASLSSSVSLKSPSTASFSQDIPVLMSNVIGGRSRGAGTELPAAGLYRVRNLAIGLKLLNAASGSRFE